MSKAKQHYFLAAGHVFFHPVVAGQEAGEVEVGSTHLNAILTTSTEYLTSNDLGRAQQALQLQMHSRTQGSEIKVVDVVFSSIISLGYMTPDEFLNTPAAAESAEPTSQTVN